MGRKSSVIEVLALLAGLVVEVPVLVGKKGELMLTVSGDRDGLCRRLERLY